MHCTRCAYPLWNLAARTCPECGQGFRPSEFTFLANAVKFLCPHCGQQYFGTSASGHLEPSSFTCVQCAAPVTEDEMIVLPADGVREEVAKAADTPWSRRESGMLRAFGRTCIEAMFRPVRLARGLGPAADTGAAWAFLWRATALSGLIGGLGAAVMMAGFSLLMSFSRGAGPAPPRMGTPTLVAVSVAAAAYPVVTLLGTVVWSACAHGVLRMFGTGAGRYDRTYECFAYACAPLAFMCFISPVLPCAWPLMFLPPVWTAGTVTAMIAERHGAGVGQALLACFGPPVLLVMVTVGAIIALVVWG